MGDRILVLRRLVSRESLLLLFVVLLLLPLSRLAVDIRGVDGVFPFLTLVAAADEARDTRRLFNTTLLCARSIAAAASSSSTSSSLTIST